MATIHNACGQDDVELVRKMLDDGGDVNTEYYPHDLGINSPYEWWITSLLELAIHNVSYKMIILLLERGVDVNARNRYGCPPLYALICGDGPYFLEDKISILKLLLPAKVNLDMQLPETGNTVLHLIMQYDGYIDMVKILLDNGADAEIRNTAGETPLDLARNEDVRLLLQSHLASRDVKNAGRRK